ncbi:MATE family efflux transporter [bacterium]|nr:MATE family efflux transporter [bacterium]
MSDAPTLSRRARLTTWSSPGQLALVVIVLAAPVAGANFLHTLVGFVDTRMVSHLGSEALAAMSVGRIGIWMIMSIFLGLGVGITAYVARTTGAGEHERARAYSTVGVIAGGVIGLLLMAIGLAVGSQPVQMMVTSEVDGALASGVTLTQRYAWEYMSIMLIGLGGLGMQFSTISVFNSLGRTVFPMWMLIITNLANLLGNYLLIPRYEMAGCAWSTTITTALVAVVGVFLLKKQGALTWNLKLLTSPVLKLWDMFKVGYPVTIQMSLRAISMLAVIKLITYLPESVIGQGALHVGLQAESLAFMPAFAFSTAAATLVGQNIGAKQIGQARTAALYCLAGSQAIMWTMALLFWLFAEGFIGIFIGSNNPEILAPAAEFLRILALCLPGLGVGMTMMGVLRGSGDTKITAWITIAAMWVLRIPLIILLAFEGIGGSEIGFGYGLTGIWWAMTISVYVEAALAYWRFATGKWAKVQLSKA